MNMADALNLGCMCRTLSPQRLREQAEHRAACEHGERLPPHERERLHDAAARDPPLHQKPTEHDHEGQRMKQAGQVKVGLVEVPDARDGVLSEKCRGHC